jgi:ABC-type iron transport system FetAB permease component
MMFNAQTKICLVTAICLVAQGYVFQYVLKVEPNIVLIFAPLVIYIAYLLFRYRIDPRWRNPLFWIAAVVLLTLADLGIYWVLGGGLDG